jgi:hypothetical protein
VKFVGAGMGRKDRHLERFGVGFRLSAGKWKKKPKLKNKDRESVRYFYLIVD